MLGLPLTLTIAVLSAHPGLRPRVCLRSSRSRALRLTEDDGQSLAEAFAAETARRGASAESAAEAPFDGVRAEAPFDGVREVVLQDGVPTAIPKRPPPPAAASPTDQIRDLIENPLFAFGVLATVGSIVLLLAIAAADADAS